MSENLCFSDVFRGYINITLTSNGSLKQNIVFGKLIPCLQSRSHRNCTKPVAASKFYEIKLVIPNAASFFISACLQDYYRRPLNTN